MEYALSLKVAIDADIRYRVLRTEYGKLRLDGAKELFLALGPSYAADAAAQLRFASLH